jgi:hypothetical protein
MAALRNRSPMLTSAPLAAHIVQATVSQHVFSGKHLFRYVYFSTRLIWLY